jgi:hypothetical protein
MKLCTVWNAVVFEEKLKSNWTLAEFSLRREPFVFAGNFIENCSRCRKPQDPVSCGMNRKWSSEYEPINLLRGTQCFLFCKLMESHVKHTGSLTYFFFFFNSGDLLNKFHLYKTKFPEQCASSNRTQVLWEKQLCLTMRVIAGVPVQGNDTSVFQSLLTKFTSRKLPRRVYAWPFWYCYSTNIATTRNPVRIKQKWKVLGC